MTFSFSLDRTLSLVQDVGLTTLVGTLESVQRRDKGRDIVPILTRPSLFRPPRYPTLPP